MKLIELSPVRSNYDDELILENEIIEVFKRELYNPLLSEISTSKLYNSEASNELKTAIRSGKISFYRGRFSGQFNSSISRELRKLGCVWDRKTQSFTILASKLPKDLIQVIDASENAFLKMAERVNRKLQEISPEEFSKNFDLTRIFDRMIYKIDNRINGSFRGLIVEAEFTEDQKKRIAEEYTNNMRLHIKDWTEKNIVSLRKKIQTNVMKGRRHQSIIKEIQDSYGVLRSKAKFLARQESRLLTSQMRETRYRDAGITHYKWVCVTGSPNHPVRDEHQALNGTIQTWDSPPVTSKDGRKNHPGQDFNCRCYARPIVRVSE